MAFATSNPSKFYINIRGKLPKLYSEGVENTYIHFHPTLKSISEMEALIEEDAVKPSNPNFEIDQAQIGNYVNEEMRSSGKE